MFQKSYERKRSFAAINGEKDEHTGLAKLLNGYLCILCSEPGKNT